MEAAEFLIEREFLNVSQEWLASYLAVSERTVARWESGHKIVPEGVVDEIVKLKQHTRGEVMDLVHRIRKENLTELLVWRHDVDYRKAKPGSRYCASWHRTMVGRAVAVTKRNDIVVLYWSVENA